MKRTILILLAVIMLFLLFPLAALGKTFTEGDYYYTLDADGNATITGCYTGTDERVIPATLDGHKVIAIGYDAFSWLNSLASITIPDSVTTIGGCAFLRCESLVSITLPGSVTSIGGSAFAGCSRLTSITLPDSVTTIGNDAFSDCSSLASITIPDSVKAIGTLAFRNCSKLTSIILPDSVTSIGGGVFAGCYSLETIRIGSGNPAYSYIDGILYSKDLKVLVTCLMPKKETVSEIPQEVEKIGDRAFFDCRISSITLPDGVISIGSGAFYECSSLSSITLPTCLTSIDKSAFQDCISLASITIPEGVTSIGQYAFHACGSLATITLPASVTSIGQNAFEGYHDYRIYYAPPGSYASRNVSPVASLSGFTFQMEDTLLILTGLAKAATEVIIPEDLDGYPIATIGKGAFANDEGLTSVTIPAAITDIQEGAFLGSKNLALNVAKGSTAERYALDNSIPIIHETGYVYTLKNGSAIITGYRGTDTVLVIPEALNGYPVVAIGDGAFANNKGLTSVTIPAAIADIREGAFIGSENLVLTVAAGSYSQQYAIRNGFALAAPNGFAYRLIDGKASIARYSGKAAKLTIPKEINGSPVASIGKNVFAGNVNLTSVTIPAGVTDIGSGAFEGCTGLKTLTLPKGLLSISAHAFSGCAALKTVKLPANVTTLGDSAFMNCTELAALSLSAKVVSIGVNAFAGCGKLKLTVPKDSYALQYANDYGIACKIGR